MDILSLVWGNPYFDYFESNGIYNFNPYNSFNIFIDK